LIVVDCESRRTIRFLWHSPPHQVWIGLAIRLAFLAGSSLRSNNRSQTGSSVLRDVGNRSRERQTYRPMQELVGRHHRQTSA